MDFTIAHRNIGAILTFGESDNLVTPPNSRGELAGAKVLDLGTFADASLDEVFSTGVFSSGGGGGGRGGGRGGGGGGVYLRGAQVGRDNDPSSGTRPATTVSSGDQVYFTYVSEAYKRITGIENVPVHRTPEGAFFQYGYFQYGVPSFSTLGWGIPAASSPARGSQGPQTDSPQETPSGRGAIGRIPAAEGGGPRCRASRSGRWNLRSRQGAPYSPGRDEPRGFRRLDLLSASRARGGGDRRVPALRDPKPTHRTGARNWARSMVNSWRNWLGCFPGSASPKPK